MGQAGSASRPHGAPEELANDECFVEQREKEMPKTDKPNILVIWGDDIGILSCYSHGLIGYRTPNIDRLAKEGIVFIDRGFGCFAGRSADVNDVDAAVDRVDPGRARCRSATSASLARIIARGAGLIAGSPGARGSPGRVTVPTPSPALKPRPAPGGAKRTVATISAPWVTSGSSPAS
jgi:hypothetical protein